MAATTPRRPPLPSMVLASVAAAAPWARACAATAAFVVQRPPPPTAFSASHRPRVPTAIFASSSPGPASSGEEASAGRKEEGQDPVLSTMPWSDRQSWALRDNLPRYVVTIPNYPPGSKYGTYAMWNALIGETTELAGYEIGYVRRAYERDAGTREDWGEGTGSRAGGEGGGLDLEAPGVLPLLDEFEFEPGGGAKGLVTGLPGIAAGSPIRTSAVSDVERTVPLGYVVTEDGSSAYELGTPGGGLGGMGPGATTEEARRSMLEGVARAAGTAVREGAEAGALAARSASEGGQAGAALDGNLIGLAGTGAALLAGASAVGMLSHHLTVNVFWV